MAEEPPLANGGDSSYSLLHVQGFGRGSWRIKGWWRFRWERYRVALARRRARRHAPGRVLVRTRECGDMGLEWSTVGA